MSDFWTNPLRIYVDLLTISCCFTPIVLSKMMNVVSRKHWTQPSNVNLVRLLLCCSCFSA